MSDRRKRHDGRKKIVWNFPSDEKEKLRCKLFGIERPCEKIKARTLESNMNLVNIYKEKALLSLDLEDLHESRNFIMESLYIWDWLFVLERNPDTDMLGEVCTVAVALFSRTENKQQVAYILNYIDMIVSETADGELKEVAMQLHDSVNKHKDILCKYNRSFIGSYDICITDNNFEIPDDWRGVFKNGDSYCIYQEKENEFIICREIPCFEDEPDLIIYDFGTVSNGRIKIPDLLDFSKVNRLVGRIDCILLTSSENENAKESGQNICDFLISNEELLERNKKVVERLQQSRKLFDDYDFAESLVLNTCSDSDKIKLVKENIEYAHLNYQMENHKGCKTLITKVLYILDNLEIEKDELPDIDLLLDVVQMGIRYFQENSDKEAIVAWLDYINSLSDKHMNIYLSTHVDELNRRVKDGEDAMYPIERGFIFDCEGCDFTDNCIKVSDFEALDFVSDKKIRDLSRYYIVRFNNGDYAISFNSFRDDVKLYSGMVEDGMIYIPPEYAPYNDKIGIQGFSNYLLFCDPSEVPETEKNLARDLEYLEKEREKLRNELLQRIKEQFGEE